MRLKMVPGLVMVLLLVLALHGPGEARPIKVAVADNDSGTVMTFKISKEKGFYKEEGLEVEVILMSPAIGIRALIAGDVESASLITSALPAAIQGAPLRVLFTSIYRPYFWLYSKPTIKAIHDLKGKKVAVSTFGSASDFVVRGILKKYGLQPDRDVAILAMGFASATRYGALVTGSIDAAMLTEPFNFIAEEAGFYELDDFSGQDVVQLGGGTVVVRDSLIQSDPVMIQKFLRGTLKGFLYARENRSETISVMSRELKMKEGWAARFYDSIRGIMTDDGTVNEELQRRALEPVIERVGLKESPPLEKIFDYSIVKKIYGELKLKGWKAGR